MGCDAARFASSAAAFSAAGSVSVPGVCAGGVIGAGGASRDGVVTAGLIALAWTTAATAGGAARLVRADA